MNMPVEPSLREVSLDDKYEQQEGSVYVTGTQALVRLPMLQHLKDKQAGKNTGGYISGYRGSPLGGYDQALWKVSKQLKKHQVEFVPGLNEDLAATAIWGTQQVNLFPGSKVDGVFGIWYGKGPGVDRCGDVFRHANQAGTAPWGGVLALAGDDVGAKSSTMAAQTDYIFQAVSMPVFAPAGVQEYLDLGFHGFAASRFSGLWMGFRCVTDTIESATVVEVSPARPRIILPQDFSKPATGVNIRWPEEPFLAMEQRLIAHKIPAALAYVRANKLDYTVWPSDVANTLSGSDHAMRTTSNRGARIGIVTTGKPYLDTMQALADLGIDIDAARRLGLAIYKVAMPYPLEPQGVREFCTGLSHVLVVEEKRGLIEGQLKEAVYSLSDRPQVIGKRDAANQPFIPEYGELSPAMLARVLVTVLREALGAKFANDPVYARVRDRLAQLDATLAPSQKFETIARIPYFCSGCPHNTSTRVPEGSRALAGIGCHYMAQWMDRSTDTFTHMGGEGMTWVGQAPFVDTAHMFQNIGDGTYWHSGSLAIRHAVATKTRMTYKILFNDAVAMTGGQRHDGQLTPQAIAQQMAAEGVAKIVVVTDEPEKYPAGYFAPGTPIHHRDKLDDVQRELRDYDGVSVLIYDQTCASEKRRRRKRGTYPDPAKRTFINELVCEGCGDCGQASNCVSIEPVETEFGRKRKVNQSSCNKDFSCVNGFCPSFVTIEGGKVRKGKGIAPAKASPVADPGASIVVPEPIRPEIQGSYALMVTGIGGTGVITIGQLLGMAAHLEKKAVSVLDMAGLAQKGGSVISFIRFALSQDTLHAPRIASASADAVIGCDLVTTAAKDTLEKLKGQATKAVVNVARMPTGDFTKNPDWTFPQGGMEGAIAAVTGEKNASFIDGSSLATSLLGDSIASNLFMLGYAYQQGLVPVSARAIERAITLNETAVEQNLKAFTWGRRAAVDRQAVASIALAPAANDEAKAVIEKVRAKAANLDEMIALRVEQLTAYENSAYAQRYKTLVESLRAKEQALSLGDDLSKSVARYLYKVMAIKDEYEVARLYTDGRFEAKLKEQFEGDYTVNYHLAPPLLAKKNSKGELVKTKYGPATLSLFKLLAKMKGLRGGALDVFGKTEERKRERQLRDIYMAMVQDLPTKLTVSNHAQAKVLTDMPEQVRGFGHVKEKAMLAVEAKWKVAQAAFHSASN